MSEKDKPQAPRENEGKEPAKAPGDLVVKSALVRTQLAAENTLMAWIRTAVSLYTFGFSITKFFDYVEKLQEGSQFLGSPRRLGLALISVGIVALLFALVGHVKVSRKLQELGLPISSRLSVPIGSGIALLMIGIVVWVSIVSNWPL
jgi:BASS family bile acid:Na+ symporter